MRINSAMDVRSIREGLGMSQQELAAALSTTQATISRWETGQATPRGPARLALQHLVDSRTPPTPAKEAAA